MPAWHQPSLISWLHVDKTIWNGLNAQQQAAIQRAAKEAVTESYKATQSIQCGKLGEMLAFNQGVMQRNHDGTQKLVNGKPVSAKITLAHWPENDLKVLKQATDDYFARLEGGAEKTDAQSDFSIIAAAWKAHRKASGGEAFSPGVFPAPGCTLVK